MKYQGSMLLAVQVIDDVIMGENLSIMKLKEMLSGFLLQNDSKFLSMAMLRMAMNEIEGELAKSADVN